METAAISQTVTLLVLTNPPLEDPTTMLEQSGYYEMLKYQDKTFDILTCKTRYNSSRFAPILHTESNQLKIILLTYIC